MQSVTVTYFPTEIVDLQEPAPVCDINKVSVIPCAEQCHSVLSQLLRQNKRTEVYFNLFRFHLA